MRNAAIAALVMLGCNPAPATAPVLEVSASVVPTAPSLVVSSAPAAIRASTDGMVLVKAGPFLRGSPPGVGLDDERPQRSIELDGFYVDKTEVTQRAYAECVEAKVCREPKCNKPPNDWDPSGRPAHPVVCIDWNDAKTYCAFRKKRLPTEAEWEKAARGTEGALYPWGNETPTCEHAHYYACGGDKKDTRPVGELPKGASPFGALDMAGNVWEWTNDFHMDDYYRAAPSKNPEGPSEGEERVVRGGAFKYDADNLLSAGRTFDEPTVRFRHVGVRCAMNAD